MPLERKKFVKKNLEVVYAILLVLIIPAIIIVNSIYTTKTYQGAIDDSINRHVLQLGRTLSVMVQNDLSNQTELQKIVKEIANKNQAITAFDIFVPDQDKFRIIASLNEDTINDLVGSHFLALAWQQPAGDGLARATFNSTPATIDQLGDQVSDERFWVVALPLKNELSNRKSAILALKTSSKVIDDLARRTARTSFIVIIFTSLILILLLSVNTRLFQYSVLYKKIKEVDQMKDEFISIASHELKTPVAGIRGYISVVLEGTYGKVNPKIKKGLQRVAVEAERLGILVSDLLNVSRIEQGRLKIEPKLTDIDPLIREVVDSLQVKAQEKKLTLKYKPLPKKKAIIKIDPERMKQILVNLVGNAIKYTPKGKVEVLVEINEQKDLNLKIKDSGIGMTAKQRERLFGKFYRVQSEKTQDIPGTGLGLWITKQLVELMDGKIFIDSMENVGTQVTIIFPFQNS